MGSVKNELLGGLQPRLGCPGPREREAPPSADAQGCTWPPRGALQKE